MTKNICRKIVFLFIAVSLLLSSVPVSADNNLIPPAVRVGLYYKDSSVNTAMSIFDVSAAAGLQAGFFINNSFTEIYRETGASLLYVRKDEYYYNDGGALKEFNLSDAAASSITAPQKYGPYHIKLGNDFPDAASAGAQAALYRQSGVQAYIAYADAWQVWAGSYTDEAAALNDTANIRTVLGEIGYIIIPPSANRIVLINSQFQPPC